MRESDTDPNTLRFRTDRFLLINGQWWIAVRDNEGAEIGPFADRTLAQSALDRHVLGQRRCAESKN